MGKDGIGMAISGGGFRATLFHLGALLRLNELAYLKNIERICSVSGGSITAAYLGLKRNHLAFDQQGVASNFVDTVAKPLKRFCSQAIDASAILGGWLSLLKSPGELLARKYDKLSNAAQRRRSMSLPKNSKEFADQPES